MYALLAAEVSCAELAKEQITCPTDTGFFDSALWQIIRYALFAVGVLVAVYAIFVIVGALAAGNVQQAVRVGALALVGAVLLFNPLLVFQLIDFIVEVFEFVIDFATNIIDDGKAAAGS